MTGKYSEKAVIKPATTLHQIREMIEPYVDYPLLPIPQGAGYYGEQDDKSGESKGLISALVKAADENQIIVRLGICRITSHAKVPAAQMLQFYANLGDKIAIQALEKNLFGALLKVDASPMGPSRAEHLQRKLSEIAAFSDFLHGYAALNAQKFRHLREKYKNVLPSVEPVIPYLGIRDCSESMKTKAAHTVDMLKAGICVAVRSEFDLPTRYFLARLADRLMAEGDTIGFYTESALVSRGLPELLAKAPGYVSVPSIVLAFTSSSYERATEVDSLLKILQKRGKAVLFTGNFSEHQALFGSGQGQAANPLQPAIVKIDHQDFSVMELLEFTLDKEPVKKESKSIIAGRINALFERGILSLENLDLINPLVNNLIADPDNDPEKFALTLKSSRETFRGLNTGQRKKRNEDIQSTFVETMTNGGFVVYLQEHLVGQKEALAKADQRLRTEFLTRPAYQPVRMLLQGIPGVGKSEFCKCLSNFFDVPHVSIDTASLQSHHEASSLLLGSGRGIVQSYMPGKLEMMARHHKGCIVEVADLDHCPSGVRAFIADLFLHILENGYAQTATGETISCANLIIVFTINLPGDRDEMVLKGLGFNSMLSEGDIIRKTTKEIKSMFSGAFISRVGLPVIFKPFGEKEKAGIMEMALRKSLLVCLENIGGQNAKVNVATGTGEKLLPAINELEEGMGARAIYDMARQMVSVEIVRHIEGLLREGSKTITISVKNQQLNIQTK